MSAPANRPPRRPTAPDGLLVVDKPAGWTSHDVVGRVRRLAGTRKVGHAGTLDPMATGVLVLGVGRATRLLTYVVGADKDYDATVRLGVTTTTEDAEGEVLDVRDASHLDRASIDDAVAALTGDLQQVPSAVSAIKVDGQRAYARVRAGETVELAARSVTVSRFEVLAVREARDVGDVGNVGNVGSESSEGSEGGEGGVDGGGAVGGSVTVLDVDVTVTVSSGTYVRALARDLGDALGVGAHLTALRRTRVGGLALDRAGTLGEHEAQADRDGVLATTPLADAARAIFPVRELTEPEARALSYGQRVAASGTGTGTGTVTAGIGPDGALVALLEDERRKGEDVARPAIVFAPA
ncbi:tRNA pseudouridine synthase B [Sediminihabitans luteus]|uniref:tRNA pseudouridine synthase B n=1 Tax=Sediminihabitans luteus TaxID=1138585 RepID=A0A2M9CCD7_9CELL|nr:tRNA pseudouridine(55) synthase TruB [Sediminihabitans luteus]PJJ69018.1 tRNA pseudouridine synthase B [Sediminihabitans luteus]GII99404.1 tRNA pseudouridine synthase B [Sediminihabitans luteus]